MKKVLLCATALVGVLAMSAPANAAGLNMGVGGYFRGYAIHTDNDEAAGTANELREFDIRRDSEVHFTGEAALDNGLTVGTKAELKTLSDATGSVAATASVIDEAYLYMSGGWGRVNLGSADAASYLLQVAAPSGDANVDGMRVFIAGLTPRITQATDASNGTMMNTGTSWNTATALDYQHADFRQAERISYLTPKYSGFQAGVSYAADPGMNFLGSNTAAQSLANSVTGTRGGVTEDMWEAAARWDGKYEDFGISVGAGYSDNGVQAPTAAQLNTLTARQYYITDGIQSWNAGMNLTFNGFSLGGSFKRSESERTAQTLDAGDLAANVASGDITRDTYVVGLGWDNGPFHAGASYLHQETDYDAIAVAANAQNLAATNFENEKFTVGGGYTFAPGMTFRGAVAWGEFDATDLVPAATDDNDFTQVTVGTDVKF